MRARVVSMPSVEMFLAQSEDYRDAVLPPKVPRASIEAGATLGSRRIVGDTGLVFGIDRSGASASGKLVAEKLGLTPEQTAQRIFESHG